MRDEEVTCWRLRLGQYHGHWLLGIELHACLFSSYCEALGVVLVAPYFEVGRSRDYQRLGRLGRGPRADVALVEEGLADVDQGARDAVGEGEVVGGEREALAAAAPEARGTL